jgi:hypothetical protein
LKNYDINKMGDRKISRQEWQARWLDSHPDQAIDTWFIPNTPEYQAHMDQCAPDDYGLTKADCDALYRAKKKMPQNPDDGVHYSLKGEAKPSPTSATNKPRKAKTPPPPPPPLSGGAEQERPPSGPDSGKKNAWDIKVTPRYQAFMAGCELNPADCKAVWRSAHGYPHDDNDGASSTWKHRPWNPFAYFINDPDNPNYVAPE